MRKALAALAIASVLALTVGGALVVSAQGPRGGGFGRGMMGRHHGVGLGRGVMHDVMTESLAEVLGMDVAAFAAIRESGLTFWQIAEGQGFTAEEIPALMVQARELALEKAVAQGLLTQEEADWMAQRHQGRWGAGVGCPHLGNGGRLSPSNTI
jgi:hypothetical protein